MDERVELERPVQGLAWRIGASVLIGLAWLAFLIIWLFFFAGGYSLYQNLAVVIVSIVLAMAALVALWLSFGLRFARQVESIDFDWKERERNWFGWRGTASMAIWAIWFGFLVAWLYFFAGDYDAYQNVAIIIVTLVLAGGASALLWSPFGGHS